MQTQAGAHLAVGAIESLQFRSSFGDVGGSGAAGRRGSFAGTSRPGAATSGAATSNAAGAAQEPEGLPMTRAQCSILKDALTWPEKLRSDVAICQGVLDAEKAALVDKLAGRIGDIQRELVDVRSAIDRMATEGSLTRHPAMNANIADIRSR